MLRKAAGIGKFNSDDMIITTDMVMEKLIQCDFQFLYVVSNISGGLIIVSSMDDQPFLFMLHSLSWDLGIWGKMDISLSFWFAG